MKPTNINNPQGILKNAKSSSTSRSMDSTAANQSTATNSFMVEGKEIVVIDTEFINKSTRNQNDVTIFKSGGAGANANGGNGNGSGSAGAGNGGGSHLGMDLVDALGSMWPPAAGHVGEILNNDKPSISSSSSSASTSQQPITQCKTYKFPLNTEGRNKSPNPIKHLGGNSTKPKNNNFKRNQSTESSSGYDFRPRGHNVASNYNAHNNASSSDENCPSSTIVQEIECSGAILTIGSMIEVKSEICDNLRGVIKWLGKPPGSDCVMVGIELDTEPFGDESYGPTHLTNGTYNGKKYFHCPSGKGIFIEAQYCTIDGRFNDECDYGSGSRMEMGSRNAGATAATFDMGQKLFGELDCPIVKGTIQPLEIVDSKDLECITGTYKGIQGHHNSCYLDATLFAMFTFTSVFDSILYRRPDKNDNLRYGEVQSILRDEIVNPLRKNQYVRADRVLKLREILEEIVLVTGLTNEEKDPEEFLNILLAQVMQLEPLLKLNSGQETYCYQLFVERDKDVMFPTVQQLFEQSFFTSKLKLKEVPSCLIIQMPRFGKNFKVYSRILPSQVLDVTDVIENSPRQCAICNSLATHECERCFYDFNNGGLINTTFCQGCLERSHQHEKRKNHTIRPINIHADFISVESAPRIFMNLFAVVCIETSHYVSFVKSGPGENAPWCFFDSMSDRVGGQNGYNIPEVIPVEDLSMWLTEDGFRKLNQKHQTDKSLPEHAKRLLCDAYMCMYQSDVSMYK